MIDPQQEQVQNPHENRLTAKTEFNTWQQKILESTANEDRRVRVERLVKGTEVAMTKAFTKIMSCIHFHLKLWNLKQFEQT